MYSGCLGALLGPWASAGVYPRESGGVGNGGVVKSKNTFRLPRDGGEPRTYQSDDDRILRRVVGSLGLRLRGGSGIVAAFSVFHTPAFARINSGGGLYARQLNLNSPQPIHRSGSGAQQLIAYLFSSHHLCISRNMGSNALARGVALYSTRGGISA